ncbi:NADP-dependent oxidoreductase [Herbiconiux sp. L3-i23]|uniref:quinone oxidoreductase family protein n=1 Tax=Herbiconiux sp. L3-i23 TaxID=2905871 RepID=UPI00204969B3|nr:NADP-dependent oxidoreductase [Herbiconiux sp. L3-i23]BDI22947.1 putative oxidoreductase [Herbiconiux sp. L3-i23]
MARAVVAEAYGGLEVLTVVEKEVPSPGIGEVTIEVRAAGVNPSDFKTISGEFGRNDASLPLPVGNEVAGVITAVGLEAGPFAEGDEVVAFRVRGGWADSITVAARSVFAKPASLSFDAAAGLLLTGTTAEHLLVATDVHDGDTVLIHGASGSVGLLAAQLAIGRGARVIGTSSAARFDVLRRFGVEPVEYGDGLLDRVREIAPEITVALDTVGTDEAVDVSVALVADRHRIATIAAFGRGGEAGIQLLGGSPGADPGTDIRNAAKAKLIALAGEGRLLVELGPSFPLEDAVEALRLVTTGHPGGKVVLHP